MPLQYKLQYIYIYIYIYIWVLFNLVNTEKGTIPSGQLDYSNFEYLNIPSKECNVKDITVQIFLKKKKQFGHIRIINLFPSS